MASTDKLSFIVTAGQSTGEMGSKATAEGSGTTASGYNSHAEGYSATASGDRSHAEGYYTEASGSDSHAEGYNATASGKHSHAEGYYTTASGSNSHTEGGNYSSTGSILGSVTIDSSDIPDLGSETINIKGPVAYGIQSHAEGAQTLAYGCDSHAEGYRTIASGNYSHTEGYSTEASGSNSHAEGYKTTASGSDSHAEGYSTEASGSNSHAEGYITTASGKHSHAEGYTTTASGKYSHAEGSNTEVSGDYSHAEGRSTLASGDYSHAEGYYTTANGYQHAGGRYNSNTTGPTSTTSTAGSIFVLGKGTSSSARSNAFRIATTGAVYGNGAYNTSGADYAEYFEWKDKNTDNQDRVGLFVTLDGENIRIANSDDDYILGVVSATPSIVGDSYFGDNWHGMYETDIFGRPIIETVHVEEYIDEETGEIVPAHDEDRWVLNPDWNHEQEYKSREDRSEWSAIGMLGKLIVIDDGTCEVNGYCKVADNGIATKSDDKSGYRVMARLDDTHIKILFR